MRIIKVDHHEKRLAAVRHGEEEQSHIKHQEDSMFMTVTFRSIGWRL